MRKLVPYAFAALAMIASVTAFAGDAPSSPQKPGKWQLKMTMDMPGMPIKMPPVTIETCVTEEDLKDPQKAVPTDKKSDCKVGDYTVEGNKVTWTVDCPKQKMKGTGEMTYSDDTYEGLMKMTVGEQEFTTKYSGKYLGACKK
jgi:hypothetical protein